MNNSQEIANLIRVQATTQRVNISQMLTEIGLGKSTLSNLENGSMLKADSLGKIAEYLGVSVDYLLGRTQKPNYNISNNNCNSNINATAVQQSDITAEMLEKFNNLCFDNKVKVINLIAELSQNKTG